MVTGRNLWHNFDEPMKAKLPDAMNLFPHEGMNEMGMIAPLNECDGMHVYGRTAQRPWPNRANWG
jgi:hypothetical protein